MNVSYEYELTCIFTFLHFPIRASEFIEEKQIDKHLNLVYRIRAAYFFVRTTNN